MSLTGVHFKLSHVNGFIEQKFVPNGTYAYSDKLDSTKRSSLRDL